MVKDLTISILHPIDFPRRSTTKSLKIYCTKISQSSPLFVQTKKLSLLAGLHITILDTYSDFSMNKHDV